MANDFDGKKFLDGINKIFDRLQKIAPPDNLDKKVAEEARKASEKVKGFVENDAEDFIRKIRGGLADVLTGVAENLREGVDNDSANVVDDLAAHHDDAENVSPASVTKKPPQKKPPQKKPLPKKP